MYHLPRSSKKYDNGVGISDMKSLLLSPPLQQGTAATEDLFPSSSSPSKNACNVNEKHDDIGKESPSYNTNDDLLQRVSSWIVDLTIIREQIERARIENAVCMDSLYMTGAIDN
jgi:hypothetical protein